MTAQTLELRGKVYAITNVSDVLVEELMQVLNDMKTGKTTGRESRLAIAELMSAACPSLPSELVYYQCREYPDGSRDRSGSVMALDMDEVAAFSRALLLNLMERRLIRLKETKGGVRQHEIDAMVKELEEQIPQFREESRHLQLDAMLRSVSVSSTAANTEAKQVEKPKKGFAPKPAIAQQPYAISVTSGLPVPQENDKIQAAAAQIVELEAQIEKLKQGAIA